MRSWSILTGAAAALALPLFLAGCSEPVAAPEPVRAVKLVTVGTSPYGTRQEFSADVRPRVETRLGFRVPGKIVQRQAELGQRVKAGQVLAQIDPQDLRLASTAAAAQVEAAVTQRDLAQADYRRYLQLKEQNFISGAELERREAALKAAQAQVEQAQAQFATQGNQAGYAALTAPSAGVVTGIEAEPGQVVAAGTPVIRLALDGPRDAVFALPEDKLALMRAGVPVQVRAWGADGRQWQGRVREVAASADPATRTYQVKVGIEGNDPPALGSTVYATPAGLGPVGAPVIKLPTSALRADAVNGKGSAVWLLDSATMTVKLQPVQVSGIDGNEAVIGAGLEPGMKVVTAGVHVLSPGQKVTVWQERRP